MTAACLQVHRRGGSVHGLGRGVYRRHNDVDFACGCRMRAGASSSGRPRRLYRTTRQVAARTRTTGRPRFDAEHDHVYTQCMAEDILRSPTTARPSRWITRTSARAADLRHLDLRLLFQVARVALRGNLVLSGLSRSWKGILACGARLTVMLGVSAARAAGHIQTPAIHPRAEVPRRPAGDDKLRPWTLTAVRQRGRRAAICDAELYPLPPPLCVCGCVRPGIPRAGYRIGKRQ